MALKAKLINWFGDIQIFPYPMFVLFGCSSYKLKGHHQREILDHARPGDVLLRRYEKYISGRMIPGYFTHSAIYVEKQQVIHMLGEGIKKEDILTFMRCDDICILRPGEKYVPNAIEKAWIQYFNKTKYDFDFDMNCQKRFYCTEFIAYLFDFPPLPRKHGLFSSSILPDAFLGCSLFEPIYWARHKEVK
jgi:hypothetical protein